MFRVVVLIFIVFYTYPFDVTAQEAAGEKIDIEYHKCLDKDTSTVNIYNCSFEAYKKWDAEMDKEYKKLIKNLKLKKDKAIIKTAQNNWTAYRDNEFLLYDNIFDRTGKKWCLLRAENRLNIVRTRTLQLREYNKALGKK